MTDKKAEIFRCGKEIFSKKGFKETKISDITEMAGVAVGSFYSFYAAKEELFIDIYLAENDVVKKDLLEKFDWSVHPEQTLAAALSFNYEAMMANPILKEWYNPEVYNKIEKYYREKSEKKDSLMMHDFSADFVRKWQADGMIRTDIDVEMILALFHACTYIDTHKEAIGIQFFPQLSHLLAGFIMQGLRAGSGTGRDPASNKNSVDTVAMI
jgi:AcrR family transcriptional regulator